MSWFLGTVVHGIRVGSGAVSEMDLGGMSQREVNLSLVLRAAWRQAEEKKQKLYQESRRQRTELRAINEGRSDTSGGEVTRAGMLKPFMNGNRPGMGWPSLI